MRLVRKEKKNTQFIFMCFACILFFIYLCLQYSKKKKMALTSKGKKKKIKFRISNFKIQKFKKKKKWDNCLILFSWAEIEPSYWATELRSQAKTILRSEPLSHWAVIPMIRPSQAEIEVAKPKSKPPSLWVKIWAIEPRYEPSRVKPRYFELFYCNQTQRLH